MLHLVAGALQACAVLRRKLLRPFAVPRHLVNIFGWADGDGHGELTCSQSAMSLLTLFMRETRSCRTVMACSGCNEVWRKRWISCGTEESGKVRKRLLPARMGIQFAKRRPWCQRAVVMSTCRCQQWRGVVERDGMRSLCTMVMGT